MSDQGSPEGLGLKKPCAIGAAILVAAIGIGLTLMNRLVDRAERVASPEPPAPESLGESGPEPGPTATGPADLDPKMTRAELYEVATELGIKGRSSMNKAQLIEAIRAAG